MSNGVMQDGRSFLVTDWITARGNGAAATSTVVQDESQWCNVPQYADATFAIEVAETTAPAGAGPGLVLLNLDGAPSHDENFFAPVVGPVVCAPTTTPLIAKSASAGASPLGRVLRWRITTSVTGAWSVTFRVRGMGNRAPYFAPTQLGKCALWLRADRGLTFTGSSVSSWADQSGIGDPNRSVSAGATNPTVTAVDTQYNHNATMAFTGASSCYFATTGTWSPTLAQPKTWVLIGHSTAASGTNYFMDGNSAGAGDAVWYSPTTSTSGTITCNSASSITSGSVNWGTPSMLLFESNGASSACYFNSVTSTLMTGNAGANGFNTMSLGVHSLAFGGLNNWAGTMAEVMAFGGILTARQKQLLKQYLVNRYAIPIS